MRRSRYAREDQAGKPVPHEGGTPDNHKELDTRDSPAVHNRVRS